MKRPRQSASSFQSRVRRAQRLAKQTVTEDAIHMRVVAALHAAGYGPTDFFHCPNGGKVSRREAGLRKQRGVGSGVPDLVFTLPPPEYQGAPGAALEIKKPGGRPSDEQAEWIAEHERRGWLCAVAGGKTKTENEAVADCLAVLSRWGYL